MVIVAESFDGDNEKENVGSENFLSIIVVVAIVVLISSRLNDRSNNH